MGLIDVGGYPPALRASRRKPIQEADKIHDIEARRDRRVVAVGVRIARGEPVDEAGEVVDVENGHDDGPITVGVAGRAAIAAPQRAASPIGFQVCRRGR